MIECLQPCFTATIDGRPYADGYELRFDEIQPYSYLAHKVRYTQVPDLWAFSDTDWRDARNRLTDERAHGKSVCYRDGEEHGVWVSNEGVRITDPGITHEWVPRHKAVSLNQNAWAIASILAEMRGVPFAWLDVCVMAIRDLEFKTVVRVRIQPVDEQSDEAVNA